MANDGLDRNIRMVVDAIDAHQFKNGLKLANALLVKHPLATHLMTTKVVLLERLEKPEEALTASLEAKDWIAVYAVVNMETLSTLYTVCQRPGRFILAYPASWLFVGGNYDSGVWIDHLKMLTYPFWVDSTNLLGEPLSFMKDHLGESADLTFPAYPHRNYSKVIEFVQFKNQLQHSHKYLMARLETPILQLRQYTDKIEEVEHVLPSLDSGSLLLELSSQENCNSVTFNEEPPPLEKGSSRPSQKHARVRRRGSPSQKHPRGRRGSSWSQNDLCTFIVSLLLLHSALVGRDVSKYPWLQLSQQLLQLIFEQNQASPGLLLEDKTSQENHQPHFFTFAVQWPTSFTMQNGFKPDPQFRFVVHSLWPPASMQHKSSEDLIRNLIADDLIGSMNLN